MTAQVRRPRIVLIGAGRFGRRHLETLQELEACGTLELLAVMTRTVASARHIRQRYQVPTVTMLTAALLQRADGVIVATPAETHAHLVHRCLRFTHVLVEKPMALGVREAERLVQAARRYRHRLMVGHVFRFHPVVRVLRKMVQVHRRELLLIEARFITPGRPDTGVGALVALLHPFDMLDYLVGAVPSHVAAATIHQLRRDPHLEDAASVFLRYPRALSAWVEVGWVGWRKVRSLTLSFIRMRVTADLLTGNVQIERPGGERRIRRLAVGQPLRVELEQFIRSLRQPEALEVDGLVGCRILRIVDAARRAARTSALRLPVRAVCA